MDLINGKDCGWPKQLPSRYEAPKTYNINLLKFKV